MTFESIFASFAVGLLATTSPCILPLYPGFLVFLSRGQNNRMDRGQYLLGVFVLAGVLTMMIALGGLIALAAAPIGKILTLIIPLADFVIILLGLLLLANINPFHRLPVIQQPIFSHPFANAFVYGLLYGPLALPCSGALIVSIFTLSLTVQDALAKLALFFFFGLGFGLPLLILSFLAGSTRRWITRQLAVHARWVNVLGGMLLVGIGIYDFAQNWESFTLIFRSLG
jgi:cytochrome c-type biogenesis protein